MKKWLIIVSMIVMFIPYFVKAEEEVVVSLDCQGDSFPVGSVIECKVHINTKVLFQSFQAKIVLDEQITTEGFSSSNNNLNVVNNGKKNQVVAVKADVEKSFPAGEYDLGSIKFKVAEDAYVGTRNIGINEIEFFGEIDNNFSNRMLENVSLIKKITITSGSSQLEEEELKDEMILFEEEEEDEIAANAEDYEEEEITNPKTGNEKLYVLIVLMIVLIGLLIKASGKFFSSSS